MGSRDFVDGARGVPQNRLPVESQFVSNRDESVRMFQSPLMERFTYVHPATPHVVFLPVVAMLLVWSGRIGVRWETAGLLAAGGLAAWTLTEYVMHRLVFHFRPRSAWQRWLFFMIHGVHHDYPNDSRRLVMPPLVSLPLASFFFGLFWLLLGPRHMPAFFAAFLVGYLCYDTLHFAIHHWAPRGALLQFIKRHHLRHHYLFGNRNYGVSTPIWDVVFGTLGKKNGS